MNEKLIVIALSLAFVACGGDDEGRGETSKPTCAIGAKLGGDAQETFSVNDDAACLVATSFGSGIDVGYLSADASAMLELGIQDVTEGEIGGGFRASVTIELEDGTRYATSTAGCSASVTEHDLESTQVDELGEIRNYRVVGTASCTEPALRSDGMPGEITLDDIAFVIPAEWRD